MLYKIAEGAVKESHYGLALARIVPLPPGLVEHATYVAQKLARNKLKLKKTSMMVVRERRRKLILNLKEHLVQAQNGVMEGDVLAAWLKELRKEFVMRMTAIDTEASRVEEEIESEDENMQESINHGDLQDEDAISRLAMESEFSNQRDRPITNASQPSVITISSGTTTELESTVRAVSENDY